MRCTDIDIVASSALCTFFLLRISFVNQSSVVRTVFELGHERLSGYELSQVLGESDFLNGTVRFSTQRVCNGEETLRFADTFFRPLDILPHRSESRWFALEVSPTPPLASDSLAIRVPLVALNVNGKVLARTEVPLKEPSQRTLRLSKDSKWRRIGRMIQKTVIWLPKRGGRSHKQV